MEVVIDKNFFILFFNYIFFYRKKNEQDNFWHSFSLKKIERLFVKSALPDIEMQ